jgi:hypothetical protein
VFVLFEVFVTVRQHQSWRGISGGPAVDFFALGLAARPAKVISKVRRHISEIVCFDSGTPGILQVLTRLQVQTSAHQAQALAVVLQQPTALLRSQ